MRILGINAAYHDPVAALVVEAGRNLGAAARTLGARAATTPFVAFSDDDSCWAPGSLASAAIDLRRAGRRLRADQAPAVAAAFKELPWVLRRRRVVSGELERAIGAAESWTTT